MEKIFFTDDEISKYMDEVFVECEKAYKLGEVPVGCIFVNINTKEILVRGHNLTNLTKNAITHAEINCINELFSKYDDNLFEECVLFVSCEPCIMCAYALCLVKIKAVYFGCENDKFGGNGSVLSIHKWPDYSYPSWGGYDKNRAIEILRKFYERGNIKAPEHKRQRKI